MKLLLERKDLNLNLPSTGSTVVPPEDESLGQAICAEALLSPPRFSGHKLPALFECTGGYAWTSNSKHLPALHLAAALGRAEMVQMLLERPGTIINRTVGHNVTPWCLAAARGHLHIVEMFLDRGMDADARDDQLRTPLSYAAEKGYVDVVLMLLKRKDVNADSKDKLGQTPLFFAASGGRLHVVNILLKREDVDPVSVSENGQTPLSIARSAQHRAVVNVLQTNLLMAD
jgi:ankyrin repeat protein